MAQMEMAIQLVSLVLCTIYKLPYVINGNKYPFITI